MTNLIFYLQNNDPRQIETKKLLLFQYKIKFMRGAKVFMEELMTCSILLCALYKWNILSIIYYLISIQMIISNVSIQFRMKITTYTCIFMLLQYVL